MGKDLFFLIEQFEADPRVTGITSYQLLVRLLREQRRVEGNTETAGELPVSVKPNKEVPWAPMPAMTAIEARLPDASR